jgi:hypothetical protein
MWLMSNTSAKTEKSRPPFPPARPAVFGSAPPAYEKAKQRLSAGRSLRNAVLEAATACGGDAGLAGYLRFIASSDSASDRSAFIGLLSRILPKNVELSGEVTTGVTIQLPWLQESRSVDKIATPPPGGVVIDQPVENINENEDV